MKYECSRCGDKSAVMKNIMPLAMVAKASYVIKCPKCGREAHGVGAVETAKKWKEINMQPSPKSEKLSLCWCGHSGVFTKDDDGWVITCCGCRSKAKGKDKESAKRKWNSFHENVTTFIRGEIFKNENIKSFIRGEAHNTETEIKNNNPEPVTAFSILDKAQGHMKDRAATYDAAGERSISKTISAFKIITDDGLMNTDERGWLFMALLKMVRAQSGNLRMDSYEDGAAYFALAGESAAVERGGK